MEGFFMKQIRNILLVLSLLLTFSLPIAAEENKELTVLFTHDLHDNLESYEELKDKKIEKRGGFARLATAIQEERDKDPQALLVDAGDFAMGTLFQTIFESHAPALRLMGQMGYDATTIGNHEFDFNSKGLNNSFRSALESQEKLPKIVASNLNFPDKDISDDLKELKDTFKAMDIKDYTMINKNNVNIAVIGLMGDKADHTVIDSEVDFDDMVKETKDLIKEIHEKEETVDMILVLSHTGTSGKEGKSEDELLASKVPEIDVIISGHSHTILKEPILVGDTILASAGRYGENLGRIKLKKSGDRWELENYKLKEINETYKEDTDIKKRVDQFKNIVNKDYLSDYNLEFDQVIAQSSFNFINSKKIGKKYQEEPLGLLIADAYKYAVDEAEASDSSNVDIALVTPGIIRDSFKKGDIRVKDIYKVSSLGIGPDGLSGYPLIDLYLTGKEIKALVEIDASNPSIPDLSQIYLSSLKYSYNPHRLPYNKVTDVKIIRNGKEEELVNDKSYRIVTNIHSAETLGLVESVWKRFLPVVPKDFEGNKITDLEKQIIYKDGHEIKEWLALKDYLKSFPEKDGIPQINDSYSKTQGFKEEVDDNSLLARIQNPNIITVIMLALPLIGLSFVLLLIYFFIKLRKKRK